MKYILTLSFAAAILSSLCACNSTAEKEGARVLRDAASKPVPNEAEVAATADSACPVEEPYKSDLASTSWTPVFLIDSKGLPKPDGGADGIVHFTFSPEFKVNGMSGDNLFGGRFIIYKNGSFRAANMYSTRRMGPYSKYEYKFMNALYRANIIRLSSSAKKMELYDGKVLLMVLDKIPTPSK